MGGKKRKVKIVKIENESSRKVTFTKRKDGLFRKISNLCLQYPETRVAILMTPLSSNSHASFYSLGHTSVDEVVYCLLSGQPPPLPRNQERSSRSELWWEDERFDTSEDVDDLNEAVNAISTMLNNVRLRRNDAVASNQNDQRLVIYQDEDHDLLEEVLQETTTNQVPILNFDSPPSFLMNGGMNDEDIVPCFNDLM